MQDIVLLDNADIVGDEYPRGDNSDGVESVDAGTSASDHGMQHRSSEVGAIESTEGATEEAAYAATVDEAYSDAENDGYQEYDDAQIEYAQSDEYADDPTYDEDPAGEAGDDESTGFGVAATVIFAAIGLTIILAPYLITGYVAVRVSRSERNKSELELEQRIMKSIGK